MTEHDENEIPAETKPAPVYADSFIPAGWDGRKCLIICAKPAIEYGWRKPKCPHCGRKTHLHRPGDDIIERGARRGRKDSCGYLERAQIPIQETRSGRRTRLLRAMHRRYRPGMR